MGLKSCALHGYIELKAFVNALQLNLDLQQDPLFDELKQSLWACQTRFSLIFLQAFFGAAMHCTK